MKFDTLQIWILYALFIQDKNNHKNWYEEYKRKTIRNKAKDNNKKKKIRINTREKIKFKKWLENDDYSYRLPTSLIPSCFPLVFWRVIFNISGNEN